MIPIKRNCRFIVDKEKDKIDGRLRYQVRWDGKRVSFLVGYRVELKKWIPDAQRCKANTTHGENKIPASEINNTLQFYESSLEEVFYKFEQEEKSPSKEELRDEYNKLTNRINDSKEYSNIQELFGLFINDQQEKKSWTQHTVKRITTVKNHLKLFDEKLTADKVNDDTMQLFINDQIKKGLKNSTIEKNYKTFKWMLRWANKKGYINTTINETFDTKFKKVTSNEIIYLTWDELIKLYEYDFSKNKPLDKVRDSFCFCCFTGLRFSDVKNLTKDDVYKDHIEIVTQKTIDRLTIELNDFSRSILKKYKKSKTNKALPVISNQKMNKYLKEIGEILKFNTPIKHTYFIGNKRVEEVQPKHKLLTTHCGRRTFVVNALRLGIPSEVIMRWTGHKDYKAMRPYIKIVDELKKEEMKKFNLKP